MTEKEQLLALRIVNVAKNELTAIYEAVRCRDLAFARILFARLETDLSVLRGLIHQEE